MPAPLRIAVPAARFPPATQTFVLQELMSLQRGLAAELAVLHWLDGEPLRHARFDPVYAAARRFDAAGRDGGAALEYWRRRRARAVEELLAALAEHSGVPPRRLAGRADVRLAFAFARQLEAWRPDYLHTYFFYQPALLGLVAQAMLGVPRGLVAYADHMLDDYDLKVVRLHLERADLVVATSRRIAAELLASCAGIESKLLVKPNGVDGGSFPLRPPPPPPPPLRLAWVARLEPKKGMLELLAAVADLRAAAVPVVVEVVGDADPHNPFSADYARRCRDEIAARSLGEHVWLHGRGDTDLVREVLARSHALVAPSRPTERGDKDGIPTAILEAMSTGRAIVTTSAGSIPEVVRDGVEGLVVAPGDSAALAGALRRLAGDGAAIARLGAAASARFRRQLDAEITEPPLHRRIQRVVTERRRAGGGG